MRFKKKFIHGAAVEKNTPPLQLIYNFCSRLSLNGAFDIFDGSNDGSFAGLSHELDRGFDFRPHGSGRKLPFG
jgi:hypothetical protein